MDELTFLLPVLACLLSFLFFFFFFFFFFFLGDCWWPPLPLSRWLVRCPFPDHLNDAAGGRQVVRNETPQAWRGQRTRKPA
jgi:hypothetical protein